MKNRVFAALSISTLISCGADNRSPEDLDAHADARILDASMLDSSTPDGTVTDSRPHEVDSGAAELRVTKISGASFAHTCALLSNGHVRCWGANDNSQLGAARNETDQCAIPDSAPIERLRCDATPREVESLDEVVDVAVGNGGTCAVKQDGSVWCWGLNDTAQLGQGENDTDQHPTPVRVPLGSATQVTYGTHHVCALLTDGTVTCWGNNAFGQCGTDPETSSTCDPGDGITNPCVLEPHAVPELASVIQLSAGRNHTCALLATGTVSCWGLNTSAALGNGEVDSGSHFAPAAVDDLTDVVQVAAGGSHTCARRSDGRVYCWGWNDLGQLGEASTTTCSVDSGPDFACSTRPTLVSEFANARDIAGGRWHTCATLSDGTTQCAGRNDDGQLGRISSDSCFVFPDSIGCSRRFAAVTDSAMHSLVAVGNYHSCAVLGNGGVQCWGAGYYGQLGNGETDSSTEPVPSDVP